MFSKTRNTCRFSSYLENHMAKLYRKIIFLIEEEKILAIILLLISSYKSLGQSHLAFRKERLRKLTMFHLSSNSAWGGRGPRSSKPMPVLTSTVHGPTEKSVCHSTTWAVCDLESEDIRRIKYFFKMPIESEGNLFWLSYKVMGLCTVHVSCLAQSSLCCLGLRVRGSRPEFHAGQEIFSRWR